MSVAQEGTLTEMAEPADLLERLHAFRHQRGGGQQPAASPGLWRHPGPQTGIASMGLALVLWLALVYSPNTVLRTFSVPIAIRNLPDEWALVDPLPTTVQVDLVGSEQRLTGLDPRSLTIALDLSHPSQVVLSEESLDLPAGIELQRVRPAVVALDLRRTQVVDVSVIVPTIGALPEGVELVSLQPRPATVSVIALEGDTPPARVLTQAVDLRQAGADVSIDSRLVLPPDTRLAGDQRNEVIIAVDVRRSSN
jgi:hypothetical protein